MGIGRVDADVRAKGFGERRVCIEEGVVVREHARMAKIQRAVLSRPRVHVHAFVQQRQGQVYAQ